MKCPDCENEMEEYYEVGPDARPGVKAHVCEVCGLVRD